MIVFQYVDVVIDMWKQSFSSSVLEGFCRWNILNINRSRAEIWPTFIASQNTVFSVDSW